MISLDACYKLILQTLLETNNLQSVVESIGRECQVGIRVCNSDGTAAATAGFFPERYDKTLINRRVPISELGAIWNGDYVLGDRLAYIEGRYLLYSYVTRLDIAIGSVIVSFEDKADTSQLFDLADIIAKVASPLMNVPTEFDMAGWSLQKSIVSQSLFFGSEEDLETCKALLRGPYVLIYCPNDDGELQMRQIVSHLNHTGYPFCYVDLGHDGMFALLYEMNSSDEDVIGQLQRRCFISMSFLDLSCLRTKMEILRRIHRLSRHSDDILHMRKSELELIALLSFASPLISGAGLTDYRVHRLLEEDEANGTELFTTLKVFLLCELNIKEAAEVLYVHRNTMVYRLRQIRKIMRCKLDDVAEARNLLYYITMLECVKFEQSETGATMQPRSVINQYRRR